MRIHTGKWRKAGALCASVSIPELVRGPTGHRAASPLRVVQQASPLVATVILRYAFVLLRWAGSPHEKLHGSGNCGTLRPRSVSSVDATAPPRLAARSPAAVVIAAAISAAAAAVAKAWHTTQRAVGDSTRFRVRCLCVLPRSQTYALQRTAAAYLPASRHPERCACTHATAPDRGSCQMRVVCRPRAPGSRCSKLRQRLACSQIWRGCFKAASLTPGRSIISYCNRSWPVQRCERPRQSRFLAHAGPTGLLPMRRLLATAVRHCSMCERCLPRTRYCALVAHNHGHLQAEVRQQHRSSRFPLLTLLLHGAPGVGKTALAAHIAARSRYHLVRVVSYATDFIGLDEVAQVSRPAAGGKKGNSRGACMHEQARICHVRRSTWLRPRTLHTATVLASCPSRHRICAKSSRNRGCPSPVC